MGQQLYGSCIGTGSANSINNLLIDDLNTLNATNQNFANALLFQSSGVDPMLTSMGHHHNGEATNVARNDTHNTNMSNANVSSSFSRLINDSSSPTTILGVLNAFNNGASGSQPMSEVTLTTNVNESKIGNENNVSANYGGQTPTTTGIGLLGWHAFFAFRFPII